MYTAASTPEVPIYHELARGKSFDIRAGAYMIDLILHFIDSYAMDNVVGILFAILYMVINDGLPVLSRHNNRLLVTSIDFVLKIIYFSIFEWLYGATPGKLILRMRVIKEDGRPCSLGSAFLRALLRIIDGFVFGLVAHETMKEPLNQRIGDQLANTIVVGSGDTIIQECRAWWWFLIAAMVYLAIHTIVKLLFFTWMMR